MRAWLLAVAFASAAEAAQPVIAASGDRSTAVKSDGSLWIWRQGAAPAPVRALPARKKPAAPTPRIPKELDLIEQVASHGARVLALRRDGRVWQWEGRQPPVRVPEIHGIDAVAAGRHHNLALDRQGLVWTWEAGATPVRVPRLRNVIAIAAGDEHSLALTSDGRLWTWGAADPLPVAVRAADGRDFNLLR